MSTPTSNAVRSVREISVLACILLVTVRLAIGWQFLYEGLWKLNTLETIQPWSAEGYLKAARGPFRPLFRQLVDDADSLAKLDYDNMVAQWDDWLARFKAHHPDLTEDQIRQLETLLNGPGQWSEPLAQLPAGVDLARFKPSKEPKDGSVAFDPAAKRLTVNFHLLPEEREQLLALVPAAARADERQRPLVANYEKAVRKLYDRSSQLSLKERLQVLLKEDPDRAGWVNEKHAGTIDHRRLGDIDLYRHLLARYEARLWTVETHFEQQHLDKLWAEIQEKKAELIGPVDALTKELHDTAVKLLSVPQFGRGPLPAAPSRTAQTNALTTWSLIILGSLLMLGLFSRVAALGAAGMLLMFYLVMPPWPGVPEIPGPEHALIVNKNLIEALACLALAALPTGRWAGLDALVRRFLLRQTTE